MNIDFVIPWVDGNDPAWQEERRKYKPDTGAAAGAARYRDMGILKYWFRAVEAYAPWGNRIHFITWGHLPEWMNTDHPKLHIVNHKDYIPAEYLPTFNSNPIELNMHRIEGLSEYFVYFNDDMLLNAPVEPDFFFHKGLPCDFAYINNIQNSDPTEIFDHIRLNSTWTINNHHSYIKSFFKHPTKYLSWKYPMKFLLKNILKLENCNSFQGFEDHHLPSVFLKSTLEESWQESSEILHYTCGNKFRTPLDVNQYIFRYKQLAEGKFHPVSRSSRGKYIAFMENSDSIAETIMNPKYKMVCVNDVPDVQNFEEAAKALHLIYEQKLPEKSEYEK